MNYACRKKRVKLNVYDRGGIEDLKDKTVV